MEEVEIFVEALHPEIMKLVATKAPANKEEAIELAHAFNDTRERIDRGRRAGNESRGRDDPRSRASRYFRQERQVMPPQRMANDRFFTMTGGLRASRAGTWQRHQGSAG